MNEQNANLSYPVKLEITRPERYQRIQLLVRLVILGALGSLHQSLIGVFVALYLLLPGVASVVLSQRDPGGYSDDDASWMTSALEWLLAFYAYMLFVTDTFPLDSATRKVRLRIVRCGAPTIGTALLRLLTSLPHALALMFCAIASCLLSLVIGALVLLTERAPDGLRDFQRGMLGWLARFFVYHVSLVDVYPPFGSSQDSLSAAN